MSENDYEHMMIGFFRADVVQQIGLVDIRACEGDCGDLWTHDLPEGSEHQLELGPAKVEQIPASGSRITVFAVNEVGVGDQSPAPTAFSATEFSMVVGSDQLTTVMVRLDCRGDLCVVAATRALGHAVCAVVSAHEEHEGG